MTNKLEWMEYIYTIIFPSQKKKKNETIIFTIYKYVTYKLICQQSPKYILNIHLLDS